jgi:prolyl-tRNA synthetase
MRWSRLHIPTLREAPAGAATPAHQLLLRAGYLRPHAPGVFSHLPLARRTHATLRNLTLRLFDAQEVLLPGGLSPAVLAEIRSYKQLPQSWAEFTTRHLDDTHPAAGVHILREYSTATIWTLGGAPSGPAQAAAALFAALELPVLHVGPRLTIPSSAGDTPTLRHTASGRAEPISTARTTPAPPALPDPSGDLTPEPFHTPGQKSIADIARFTGLPETSQMKSLVLVADTKPYLVSSAATINSARPNSSSPPAPPPSAPPSPTKSRTGSAPPPAPSAPSASPTCPSSPTPPSPAAAT